MENKSAKKKKDSVNFILRSKKASKITTAVVFVTALIVVYWIVVNFSK